MTDLERLFRRLVDNLIAIDPARLHRTLTVEELYSSVIPYRSNRRSLAIDTAEDYDGLLLRLVSGEGGYVEAVAEEAAARFQAEAQSAIPNLDVLRELGHAEVRLATEPLAHALGPGPEESFAPPDDEPELPPTREEVLEVDLSQLERHLEPPSEFTLESLRQRGTSTPPPTPSLNIAPVADDEWPRTERRAAGPRCSFCGGRLPANRTVNFCPHCGQNQTFTRCPECQAEIELGWKHCISCGHQVE